VGTVKETLLQYLRETVRFKKRLGLVFPEGYNYQGGEDYVLDRGSPFSSGPLTPQERTTVLQALTLCPEKHFRLGHCYYNAQLLVAFDTSRELIYCEGWAIGLNSVPTLHGWASINGKVVDLTWKTEKPRHRGRLRNRIWGTIPEDWAYYGATFDTDSLLARMHRIGATGSFLDDVAYGFPLFREPRLRTILELTTGGDP